MFKNLGIMGEAPDFTDHNPALYGHYDENERISITWNGQKHDSNPLQCGDNDGSATLDGEDHVMWDDEEEYSNGGATVGKNTTSEQCSNIGGPAEANPAKLNNGNQTTGSNPAYAACSNSEPSVSTEKDDLRKQPYTLQDLHPCRTDPRCEPDSPLACFWPVYVGNFRCSKSDQLHRDHVIRLYFASRGLLVRWWFSLSDDYFSNFQAKAGLYDMLVYFVSEQDAQLAIRHCNRTLYNGFTLNVLDGRDPVYFPAATSILYRNMRFGFLYSEEFLEYSLELVRHIDTIKCVVKFDTENGAVEFETPIAKQMVWGKKTIWSPQDVPENTLQKQRFVERDVLPQIKAVFDEHPDALVLREDDTIVQSLLAGQLPEAVFCRTVPRKPRNQAYKNEMNRFRRTFRILELKKRAKVKEAKAHCLSRFGRLYWKAAVKILEDPSEQSRVQQDCIATLKSQFCALKQTKDVTYDNGQSAERYDLRKQPYTLQDLHPCTEDPRCEPDTPLACFWPVYVGNFRCREPDQRDHVVRLYFASRGLLVRWWFSLSDDYFSNFQAKAGLYDMLVYFVSEQDAQLAIRYCNRTLYNGFTLNVFDGRDPVYFPAATSILYTDIRFGFGFLYSEEFLEYRLELSRELETIQCVVKFDVDNGAVEFNSSCAKKMVLLAKKTTAWTTQDVPENSLQKQRFVERDVLPQIKAVFDEHPDALVLREDDTIVQSLLAGHLPEAVFCLIAPRQKRDEAYENEMKEFQKTFKIIEHKKSKEAGRAKYYCMSRFGKHYWRVACSLIEAPRVQGQNRASLRSQLWAVKQKKLAADRKVKQGFYNKL